MAGYIGKISAIVTANTSDFSRKMQGLPKDVERFSRSLQSSLNSASSNAQKSLEKIFTPLQQLERKLKTASDRGLNLKLPVDQIRSFVSVAEGVNKPIEKLAGGFTKLSAEVQAAFLPALNRVQNQAVRVGLALERSGRIAEGAFNAVALEMVTRKIEETTQAYQRLSQAQQIAGRALSGNELQFASPAAFQSLSRTADLTQQAGALSAGRLADGSIAVEVRELNRLATDVQQKLAQIDSLRLDPNVNSESIRLAERELQQLVSTAATAQDRLQSIIAGNPTGEFGPPRPFTDRDATGRSIQQRLADINRLREAEAARANAARLSAEADEAAAQTARIRAQAASQLLNVLQRESDLISSEGLQTTQDATGRSIQQRLADINRLREAQRQLSLESASGSLNVLSEADVQADRARRSVTNLRQEVSRLRDSFDAVGNRQFFDSAVLRRQQGELTAIRDIIGRVSADVRGPLVQSFQRYATAVTAALENGEAGWERNSAAIRRQRAEVVALIAATGQVGGRGRIDAQIQRAGDVARGGFGNLQLGLQQAAFAIDDFFSVTGGVEQRIRAIGNNVTQLGFLVGQTRGLFIALGAVLAAQAAVAIAKYIGVLQNQKDVLDAVNGTLREQKDRVEQLTRAYDQLASSVRDAGLTQVGRTQAERSRQRAEIERLERERQADVKASVDPQFRKLTIERSTLLNRLSTATGIGERAAIDAQLRELEPRIAAARERAASRPTTGRTVAQVLADQDVLRREAEAASLRRSGSVIPRAGSIPPLSTTLDLSTTESQRSALNNAIVELVRRIGVARGFFGGFDRTLAAELDAQLQTLIRELADFETRVRDALPAAAFKRTFERIQAAADGLDRASANVDQAGLGGGRIDRELTRANESANALLTQAQEARARGDLELARTIEESALGLQAWASQLDSAANAASIFSEVLRRVSDELNDTVEQEARGRADQARRRASEARAAFRIAPGRSQEEAFAEEDRDIALEQRYRADLESRRAERVAASVRQRNQELRQQFEDDALAGRIDPGTQRLIKERQEIQRQLDEGNLGIEQQRAARQRQAEIDAELDRRFENSAAGREARENADDADIEASRARLEQDSVARGLELLQSPAEKAARSAVQALSDIERAIELRRAAGLADLPAEEVQAARQRVLDDARRQIAPAVFALRDQVDNAVLQGPSRAALTASDITTQAGTAELNRLLRGDDSARDQNLLELQKQTAELEKLNANLGGVGVV